MKYLKYYIEAIIIVLVLYLIKTTTIRAFQFPVPELGNCRDSRECHLFCKIPSNQPACWSYSVYGVKENVLGETTGEEKLAALGIIFPIAGLGNCSDIASCRQYCQDQTHKTICQTFAQNHKLTKKQLLVEKAQQELGCASLEECRQFCSQETNQELCQNFTKKYHLKVRIRLLQLAQEQLGCSTKAECKQFCNQEQNQPACKQFMQQNQIKNTRREQLLDKAKEQLGCNTYDECKQFCQNPTNADTCRNFGQVVRTWGWGVIQKQAGCDTVEACRKICQENPSSCPKFPGKLGSPAPRNSPQPSPSNVNQLDSNSATGAGFIRR